MNEISEKQLIANTENAKLGGVKTQAGKAITKFNALRHGILSKEVVIKKGDGKEDIKEFAAISKRLVEELQPVGLVEEMLVDDLVSIYWRRQRVLKAENGEIRKKTDNVSLALQIKENDTEFIKRHDVNDADTLNSVLGIKAMLHMVEISKEDIETSGCLEEETKKRLFKCYDYRPSSYAYNAITFSKMLQNAENGISNLNPVDVRQMFVIFADAEKERLRNRLKLFQKKEKLEKQSKHLTSNVPGKEALEVISRYEAHLSRAFYRALNELQKVQAMRLGIKLPSESPININLNQINQNN